MDSEWPKQEKSQRTINSKWVQHDKCHLYYLTLSLGVLPGAAISIWMIGEMLAMLPSLKALGAGIGSLNQLTLGGRKSLDSTANWVAVLEEDTSGRK